MPQRAIPPVSVREPFFLQQSGEERGAARPTRIKIHRSRRDPCHQPSAIVNTCADLPASDPQPAVSLPTSSSPLSIKVIPRSCALNIRVLQARGQIFRQQRASHCFPLSFSPLYLLFSPWQGGFLIFMPLHSDQEISAGVSASEPAM